MNFPSDLLYAKSHEWVRKDGGTYVIGLSDFAQDELGDIVLSVKGGEYRLSYRT